MVLDSAALRTRLDQLRALGANLAALLVADAEYLETDGRPPSDELLDELVRYQQELCDLGASIHGDAQPNLASLDQLELALAGRVRRQTLIRDLDRVLAVEHEDAGFASIRLLHEDVQSLRRKLVEDRANDKELAAWESPEHPWRALLRLVEFRDQIDDVEWSRLNDVVTESIGRPIAVAVARGKLSLNTDRLPPPLPTDAQPTTAAVAPVAGEPAPAVSSPVGPAASVDRVAEPHEPPTVPQRAPADRPARPQAVAPAVPASSVSASSADEAPRDDLSGVDDSSSIFEDIGSTPPKSPSLRQLGSRQPAPPLPSAVIAIPPAPTRQPPVRPGAAATPSTSPKTAPAASSPAASSPAASAAAAAPVPPAAAPSVSPSADGSSDDGDSDHLWDDFPAPRKNLALAASGKILQDEPATPVGGGKASRKSVPRPAPKKSPGAASPPAAPATPEPALPSPLDPGVTLPADLVPAPLSTERRSLESAQSIFDDEGLDSGDPLPASIRLLSDGRSGRSLGRDSINAGPDATQRLATALLTSPKFIEPDGTLGEMAALAYTGDHAERRSLIPDLILELIFEGRPGLAFHLSTCLERLGRPGKRFLPSWLIRAYTLGQAILFPKGQLAGQIQDDLERFNLHWVKEQPDEWARVLRIMLRAAALRPAIVAPTTRAAGIVRAFSIEDDCIQLYNYCARIGATGEKLGGVYPGVFKRAQDSTPLAENLALLQSDVRAWQAEVTRGAIRYEPSTQLFLKTHWSVRTNNAHRYPDAARAWQKWQQLLRMVDGVLTSVVNDQRSELQRVRVEIDRLAQQTWIDDERAARSPASPVVLPVDEMKAFLRQAIGFGERWVALHGSASIHRNNYVPPEAEELRQDVEGRHNLVTTELQEFLTRHNTYEQQKAIACLLLAMQEVRDLVNPQLAADSQEPDQRHLLNAELLKIPDLRLNSGWEPMAEPQTVEDEILKFLASPQPDWATAFQMHMTQGHHGSAQRILALRHWTQDERASLQSLLESDRERVRNDFRSDLDEVQRMVHDALHEEIVAEADRGGFEARLERLRRALQSEDDLSSAIIDLNRLKENVERRRVREEQRASTPPIQPARREGWVMDFSDE